MKAGAFALYTVVLLKHGERYLLLKRAETKRLAPGRWTGLGGRVEPDELGDLHGSALRELEEETGLTEEALEGFTLRRALYHNRPGDPLTGLLYFTATLKSYSLPDCSEGTLHWCRPEDFGALDIIETTREVLPLLLSDQRRDPAGGEPVRIGVTRYLPDGRLVSVAWSSEP